ncbi:MAG TPA: pilus assembly protein TadG-related protein [Rhizobiaceae bacterium]|nr:pilus assembly protein TadG-related protein [Rhizobiaceae bacterium]
MRHILNPANIRRFSTNQDGNFAMMLALAMPMMVAATGIGIDYARMASAKNTMNTIVDAAVLAVTRDITTGVIDADDAEAAVRGFIDGNLAAQGIDKTNFVIDDVPVDLVAKTVGVKAHSTFPLALMSIAGIKQTTIEVESAAEYSDVKVELAMALDITGSMGYDINGVPNNQKLNDLKSASLNALSILMPETAPKNPRVRVGLVPYAGQVNAGAYAKKATKGASTKCVSERIGPDKYSDAAPGVSPVGPDLAYGNPPFKCREAAVQPLTTNRKALETTIKSFTASGCTAGHIATAWSYYMLSPQWSTVWPAASAPEAMKTKGVKKIAVLMTDGVFNTHYNSGVPYNCDDSSGSATKANSEQYALKLCESMRANGITVYTIAFAAPTQAAAMMKACATPDTSGETFFFDAKNGAQLTAAFEEIARNIQKLRLTK